jgi:hypothetical protein
LVKPRCRLHDLAVAVLRSEDRLIETAEVWPMGDQQASALQHEEPAEAAATEEAALPRDWCVKVGLKRISAV